MNIPEDIFEDHERLPEYAFEWTVKETGLRIRIMYDSTVDVEFHEDTLYLTLVWVSTNVQVHSTLAFKRVLAHFTRLLAHLFPVPRVALSNFCPPGNDYSELDIMLRLVLRQCSQNVVNGNL